MFRQMKTTMMEMRDGIQSPTWKLMKSSILFLPSIIFLTVLYLQICVSLAYLFCSKPLPSRVKREIVEPEAKDSVCPVSYLFNRN